jgi:Tfp pilus assembly protein PilN
MNNARPRRVTINLASAPLRNRNLFFSLAGLLGVLIVAGVALSGLFFIRYHARCVQAKSALEATELAMETARTETTAYLAKSQEASAKLKAQVDFANEIIDLKSLSWTQFLSQLETSLPGGSYIVALAPNPVGQARFEVQLRVVFSSVAEELEFIKNLKDHSFADIRLMGEEQTSGRIVSEVSLSYEERR